MSEERRTRQLVKAFLRERERSNAFQRALGKEVLKVIRAKVSDIIAKRMKTTVTPAEGDPCEDKTQD